MRTSGSTRPGASTGPRRGTTRPSSSTRRLTYVAIQNEVHAERDRHVAGKYQRSVDRNDTFDVGEHYEERFEGGVDFRASIESQAIVGGAYAGVVAGPCLRISGWVDYLGWGAWSEADAARVEIAGVMVRSQFANCHFAGARVVRATSLVDDFRHPDRELRRGCRDLWNRDSHRRSRVRASPWRLER